MDRDAQWQRHATKTSEAGGLDRPKAKRYASWGSAVCLPALSGWHSRQTDPMSCGLLHDSQKPPPVPALMALKAMGFASCQQPEGLGIKQRGSRGPPNGLNLSERAPA